MTPAPRDPAPGSRSASSTASTGSAPAAPVHLGLIFAPDLVGRYRDPLLAELPDLLESRFPGVEWTLSTATEDREHPAEDALGLLEATRDRMLDEGWDIAVAITDEVLRQGRHTYAQQVSAAHAAGVISVPALGVTTTSARVAEAVVAAVGVVLGVDPDGGGSPEAVAERARQLATDVEDRQEENVTSYTARVLGGNVRLLLGMVRTNRPWLLAVRLSKSLTVALASGVLTLVTTDLWLLSSEYSPLQMTLLGLVSVGAVTGALIVGAGLWEQARRDGEREQVTLFNAATVLTVLIGVMVLHLMLFVASLGGALLLVDADVFTEVTGEVSDLPQYLKLAWLVGGLATLGGALGAGLENEDVVRAAAYTRTG